MSDPSEANSQTVVSQRVRGQGGPSPAKQMSGRGESKCQATERNRLMAYRGPGSGCRKDQSQAVEPTRSRAQ